MTNLLIYWSASHYHNSPLLRLIFQQGLVETQSRPTHDTSQDCEDVRSYHGLADTPVQLLHSLDFLGCRWHARQVDQRRHETAWSNQDLLQKWTQGYHRTRRAWPGHNLDLSTSLHSHSPICIKGKWSNTVQPDGSVFSGRRSHWINEHCHQAMPHRSRPYKDKLWWVHQRLRV